MKVVGLTGGIATGKSTVSRYLLSKNIPVIDCDRIARQVVDRNTPGLKQLVQRFGKEILTKQGDLNRSKLGEIIFNNQEERFEVNQLLHPLIDIEMKKQLLHYQQKQEKMVILDIPLLYEEHYENWCEEVVVVYVSNEIQIERLMQRNRLTRKAAESRIAAQLPIEDKKLLADFVVDNSGCLEKTYQQVDKWLLEKNT